MKILYSNAINHRLAMQVLTPKLSSLVASLMVLVIGLEGHYDREPRREQFTVHGMFGRNVSD